MNGTLKKCTDTETANYLNPSAVDNLSFFELAYAIKNH